MQRLNVSELFNFNSLIYDYKNNHGLEDRDTNSSTRRLITGLDTQVIEWVARPVGAKKKKNSLTSTVDRGAVVPHWGGSLKTLLASRQ